MELRSGHDLHPGKRNSEQIICMYTFPVCQLLFSFCYLLSQNLTRILNNNSNNISAEKLSGLFATLEGFRHTQAPHIHVQSIQNKSFLCHKKIPYFFTDRGIIIQPFTIEMEAYLCLACHRKWLQKEVLSKHAWSVCRKNSRILTFPSSTQRGENSNNIYTINFEQAGEN